MGDVQRLLRSFESGELLRPSGEVPNIVDLSSAIARFGGLEFADLPPNSDSISRLIGEPDHLVFVAADGLGLNTVRAMGENAFISAHMALELRTVFPSSTPVVFTSFATGRWPSVHAVVAWHMYLREADCVATIIRFHRRSDDKDLGELGMEAGQAFPVPSLIGRFSCNVTSLLPEGVVNTVYSAYTSGDTTQAAYKTLPGAVDTVLARVKSASAPTFTYLYSPDVDFASHQFGVEHERTLAVARDLDRQVERLVAALPLGSRVVLTADHGLLDARGPDLHAIEPGDEIAGCLGGEPWGDARAANFGVREAQTPRFERLFRTRFEEDFFLLTTDEVEGLELYGPGRLSSHTRGRLGSHIAISRGSPVLQYNAPTVGGEDVRLVGHHSGLTPQEMLVPLMVA